MREGFIRNYHNFFQNIIYSQKYMDTQLFTFQKMDLNQDGVVSLEEFLTFNKEDFKMVQSLDSLKTINV